jgi:hypothetical protein
MVHIIFDELVKLGVQFRLLFSVSRIGTAIWELHEALKGNPDAFAAIMTRYTGFMGNS